MNPIQLTKNVLKQTRDLETRIKKEKEVGVTKIAKALCATLRTEYKNKPLGELIKYVDSTRSAGGRFRARLDDIHETLADTVFSGANVIVKTISYVEYLDNATLQSADDDRFAFIFNVVVSDGTHINDIKLTIVLAIWT